MATSINETTGVEYDDDTGVSTKLYVPVSNGQVLNANGVHWRGTRGAPHDFEEDYYELVPPVSAPYDPELVVVDSENSGWGLHPARNAQGQLIAVPNGHPKGTYKYTEILRRRSAIELKETVTRYCTDFNETLMRLRPQDAWYKERLEMAKEEIAKGSTQPYFVNAVEKDDTLVAKLRAACRHNDDNKAFLFAEIDRAGEAGPIDFVLGQMATVQSNGQQLTGWVNGIPE